ncbi:AfsR/SARP family transcriptional regulator [Actinokineospora iranica]|uniref:DNA-binding transcriptional activator of the SARP family n=1 Tax=Actinokineospora iranica TaxID=1271860 RepID=A0A1G6P9V9_9PSEU|nr:BTAD domain-containing putative transcriptional regulator [Actinokineospora iranica]SDC76394.1 DNA-binding transcriptional activator of the SARP family [Actinokineospora iranica]
MRILVLGPVRVRIRDAEAHLGGPESKALLSALLLQARQVVPTDRLIGLLWDDSPPRSAAALVRDYISLLRRGLAAAGWAEALAARSQGYLLAVDAADSDLETFERTLAAGRQAERAADHGAAAERYGQALGLWRGPAFCGIDAGFARARARVLAEERLSAEEGLARCLLAQGRAGELCASLRALVVANPLREEARGLLMRALVETGRQADALAVYRELAEPGEPLRDLHEAIRSGALERRVPRQRVETTTPMNLSGLPGPPRVVPGNLPPDICDFTGRAEPLATVLRLAEAPKPDKSAGSAESAESAESSGARTSPPTVVVSGFGGSGKSALAVHAAHRLRARCPDGALFADLRGRDRDLGAFDVLGRFLGALGVAGSDLPATVADRAALFRRTVAGRRLVIVLDNARNETQVRPLLPDDPHCLVIITSRSRLTGIDGATPVELDFFSTETAVEMLGKIIGADRVAAAPDAAARIATLCGGIPLAIRAAGAKLLAEPDWPLPALAARLSDERRRLDELAVGDLAVRSSLLLNYRELDDLQRRAFHLLSVLDLPDFGWWLAAPLLDIPLEDAQDAVARLVDLRLLEVAGLDRIGRVRYRLHDLVQLFGAEHAEVDEPADMVAAAVSRTLATWMALVEAGSRKLPRVTLRLRPNLAANVEVDPRLVAEVEDNPTEWLKSETATVVRAVERAHDLGIDGMTTLLITTLLSSPFAARNEFDGWQRTHEVALTAARSTGDRQAEAVVLAGLGQLHYEKDEYAAALEHFTAAVAHTAATGDDATRAVALVGLGTVRRDLAEIAGARRDLAAAADVGARIGDGSVVAAARYGLAAISRDHGAMADAVTGFERCVELYRGLADLRGEALALRGLSLCHRARGEHGQAAELSERAAAVLSAAGDELGETYARQSWAKALLRLGASGHGQDTTGKGIAGQDIIDTLTGCLATCVSQCDRFGVALMTRTLGEAHLALGDRALAADVLGAALRGWEDLGLPLWQARTLRDLAAADPALADAHWRRATALFAASAGREAAELAAHTPASWYEHVRSTHR